MIKILAIGASTSKESINRQLANYAAMLTAFDVEQVNLNDYEMPIYGIDKEKRDGAPKLAHDFRKLIENSSGIVLSLSEHNGSYTAAFKNIIDWVSRVGQGIWCDKPMLLLATSPGVRGAVKILNAASEDFPWRGARLSGSFSLPSFPSNFDSEKGITDEKLKELLLEEIHKFEKLVTETDREED